MTFMAKKLAEAEALLSDANSDEAKERSRLVYQAFRESNPKTSPELDQIDASIASAFSAFQHAILTSNSEMTGPLSDRLLILIKNRDRQCETKEART